MVQPYRKRHSYATKSNKTRVVKIPEGRLVYQYTNKRASGPKCPVTGKRIIGSCNIVLQRSGHPHQRQYSSEKFIFDQNLPSSGYIGYSEAQLKQCLEDFAALNVWQIHPNTFDIHFIDA